MIKHIVMLCLTTDHDATELLAVMAGLADLPLDGFCGFDHGPNIDAEGKSPEYPYGFICHFTDAAALARYASDPAHQALGGRLVALCDGGGDGIMVYDLEISA